jgi:hypothetical protein
MIHAVNFCSKTESFDACEIYVNIRKKRYNRRKITLQLTEKIESLTGSLISCFNPVKFSSLKLTCVVRFFLSAVTENLVYFVELEENTPSTGFSFIFRLH